MSPRKAPLANDCVRAQEVAGDSGNNCQRACRRCTVQLGKSSCCVNRGALQSCVAFQDWEASFTYIFSWAATCTRSAHASALAGAPPQAAAGQGVEQPRQAPPPSAQQPPAASRPAHAAWEARQLRARAASARRAAAARAAWEARGQRAPAASLSEQELRLLDASMAAALASASSPRLYDVAKAFDVLLAARWQPSDSLLLAAAAWLDQRTAGGRAVPAEDLASGNAAWCLRTLLLKWTAFALRSACDADSAACRTLPQAQHLLLAGLDCAAPGASAAARKHMQMALTTELRAVRTMQALEAALSLTGPQWNVWNTLTALQRLKDMCALHAPPSCSLHVSLDAPVHPLTHSDVAAIDPRPQT